MGSETLDTPMAPDDGSNVIALVYDELRALAGSFFQHERADHTLQSTALVHEAYLRLLDQDPARWRDKTHFVAVAAGVMRHVLVDHARRHRADKRYGRRTRLVLADEHGAAPAETIDLLALDEALIRLAEMDEQQARIVELRFFGGLTVAQISETLQLSSRSVDSDWALARAWLSRELACDEGRSDHD